jgi:hypothetical protein
MNYCLCRNSDLAEQQNTYETSVVPNPLFEPTSSSVQNNSVSPLVEVGVGGEAVF